MRFRAILFLLVFFVLRVSTEAQFLGYAAQQVVTKTFSVTAGAPTPRTEIVMPNYGQAGHTLQLVYGAASANCTTMLQVSNDGTNYFSLVAVPNINGTSTTQIGYGNGYFPFLKVITNANSAPGCTTSISGTYTGYQYPIPWQATVYNAPHNDISAPVTITTKIEYGAPQILVGFDCYNPTGAVAWLQIADRNPPPGALGSFILYQIAVPAGETVADRVPIYSGNALSAGASTTEGGGVAIAGALVCNFQLNLNGPFGPFLGMPNRL